MKQSKQLLLFSLILVGFSVLECVLTVVFSPLLEKVALLATVLPFLFRALAILPPFFTLGIAFCAVRVRSFPYALSFLGIYAMVYLIAQIPLSLAAFLSASTASYGTILFSYMLTATITALLFLLLFVLGYALFLQGASDTPPTAIFTLSDSEGRALALAASLLTLYSLVREIIDILAYAKDKLYILTGEDLISMLVSILFFLALGVLGFAAGREAPRILPTAPLFTDEEDDFV